MAVVDRGVAGAGHGVLLNLDLGSGVDGHAVLMRMKEHSGHYRNSEYDFASP